MIGLIGRFPLPLQPRRYSSIVHRPKSSSWRGSADRIVIPSREGKHNIPTWEDKQLDIPGTRLVVNIPNDFPEIRGTTILFLIGA